MPSVTMAANPYEMKLKDLKKSASMNLGRQTSLNNIINEIVCISWDDLRTKYIQFDLSSILQENCGNFDDVDRVSTALNILSKYAMNLLVPLSLRPAGWNIIEFCNHIFRERVHRIKGTHIILCKLGYEESLLDALVFPSSLEPDCNVVAEVTVELLAGKTELEYYMQNRHPCPQLIEKYLTFIKRSNENSGLHIVKHSASSEEGNGFALKETEETKDVLPGNIPLMVLDHVVSIAPNESGGLTDILASDSCDICGDNLARWTCPVCDSKNLCDICDMRWHQHPNRRTHKRIPFSKQGQVEKTANGHFGNNMIPGQLPESTTRNMSSKTARGEAAAVSTETKSSYGFSPLPIHNRPVLPNSSSKMSSTREKKDLGYNDDDDIQTILKQAKPPPNFYIPPVAPGARHENEDFSLIGGSLNVLQPSRIALDMHKPAGLFGKFPPANGSSQLGTSFDRSASESALSKAGSTLVSFEWNCEHCTFRNTTSNNQKRQICSMCLKTSDDVEMHLVQEKKLNEEKSLKVAPMESASQLLRTNSAFEPRHPNKQQDFLTINKPQFKSKFVEFQDEVFREKKKAQERFMRENQPEQNQSEKQTKTSIEKPPLLPEPLLPEQQKTSLEVTKATVASGSTGARSLEDLQANASLKFAGSREPVKSQGSKESLGSYYIERKPYKSRFVDKADEIYLEKKAAQERFRLESSQSQVQSSAAESGLQGPAKSIDQVELQAHRFKSSSLFEVQPTSSGPSSPKAANLATISTSQPSKGFGTQRLENVMLGSSLGSLTSGGGVKTERNVSNKVEQLKREKHILDMYASGMTVVRLVKAVEAQGYLEEEVECILSLCQNASDPYSFFRERWSMSLSDLLRKLQDRSAVSKGSVPLKLARLSLAEAHGDIDSAVDVFDRKCKEKIDVILNDCNLEKSDENRQRISRILDTSNGDVNAAKCILIRERFSKNIWKDSRWAVDAETPADDIYQRHTQHLDEDLAKQLVDHTEPRERRVRMILAEADLPGWLRAENVVTILEDPSFVSSQSTLVDVVDAVKNRGSLDECRQFLQQECEICYDVYPSRLIKSMGCCQCKICSECTKDYFEVVIRERFVRNLVCPVCSLPDIDTSDQTETHFQFLLLLLRNLVSQEVYELFQMKLRDWNLMMDPYFRWCASNECKSGFLIDPDQYQKKIACPHCNRCMCQLCKKLWEDQHDGLTCEDFQSWKENNDPEVQALGLARHLEENGIECPRCKCRYSLAKGGCMHFTCMQCRHEFCSGCLQPFRRGKNCSVLKSCGKAGLHCHHPRDCLFYLRDRDVKELQKLLEDNNVPYDTEASNSRVLAGAVGDQPERCRVMEQKQTQNGFKDEPCGKEVPEDFAGLCEIHYKEYLVGLINKNGIDPASIMTQDELINLLKRVERTSLMPKRKGESNDQYRLILSKIIMEKLPLPSRPRSLPSRQTSSLDETDRSNARSTSASQIYHRNGNDFADPAWIYGRENEPSLVGRGVGGRSRHRRLFEPLDEPRVQVFPNVGGSGPQGLQLLQSGLSRYPVPDGLNFGLMNTGVYKDAMVLP